MPEAPLSAKCSFCWQIDYLFPSEFVPCGTNSLGTTFFEPVQLCMCSPWHLGCSLAMAYGHAAVERVWAQSVEHETLKGRGFEPHIGRQCWTGASAGLIFLYITHKRAILARDLRKCTLGAKNAKRRFLCQNVPWTLLVIFWKFENDIQTTHCHIAVFLQGCQHQNKTVEIEIF